MLWLLPHRRNPSHAALLAHSMAGAAGLPCGSISGDMCWHAWLGASDEQCLAQPPCLRSSRCEPLDSSANLKIGAAFGPLPRLCSGSASAALLPASLGAAACSCTQVSGRAMRNTETPCHLRENSS